MAHLANVRLPEAKSKKQALAMFAHTDRARVADITSRYDGKPVRASDLDGSHPTDTIQIRYAADRKVAVVTMRDVTRAAREDLPSRDPVKSIGPATLRPTEPHKIGAAASYVDVYRECVIALNCLDADDDAPHRWRDRLPLYALATRQHRAAIDLGDLDERMIATRARDAAFRGVIACK
jgi:hypothetical protein